MAKLILSITNEETIHKSVLHLSEWIKENIGDNVSKWNMSFYCSPVDEDGEYLYKKDKYIQLTFSDKPKNIRPKTNDELREDEILQSINGLKNYVINKTYIDRKLEKSFLENEKRYNKYVEGRKKINKPIQQTWFTVKRYNRIKEQYDKHIEEISFFKKLKEFIENGKYSIIEIDEDNGSYYVKNYVIDFNPYGIKCYFMNNYLYHKEYIDKTKLSMEERIKNILQGDNNAE